MHVLIARGRHYILLQVCAHHTAALCIALMHDLIARSRHYILLQLCTYLQCALAFSPSVPA